MSAAQPGAVDAVFARWAHGTPGCSCATGNVSDLSVKLDRV